VDRRSVIIVATLVAVLAVAIGVGVVLSSGGGNESVRTPTSSTPTTAPTTSFPSSTTTTTTKLVPQITVPTTPKPTVVINPPPTATPTTTAPATSTTTGGGGSEAGITPTEIRVSVIADTAAAASGTQAWATEINAAGGLAGRKLRVDVRLIASAADYATATANACKTSFAVVGSSSRFDSQSGNLLCGIPEVAARLFSNGHRSLPNVYAVIPARDGVARVGAFRHLLGTVDGCCRQYVLVPTNEPDRATVQQSVQGATAIGFSTAATPDVASGPPPPDYTALVTDLVAKHATFAQSGLGATSTVRFRQAAAANPAASVVKAWYCDASCDDPSFLTSGGSAVEGQFVDLDVNPLSDQHRIPTMAAYVKATRTVTTPTTAGLESYSAGLLFEQVARQVVATNGPNGLTRAQLLTALSGVHSFDAGGILGVTDVAARQPTGCYMLLRVHGGRFVRSFPTTPAHLDCGTQNLQTVPTGG
jgi:ABC-type branched-subunit amino acid transport system substrate-binding protein